MKLANLFEAKVSVTAYHGTNVDISKFSGIVYFTTQQDAAEGYARGKKNIHKRGDPVVYEVKLKFENPIYYKTMQQIGTLDLKTIESLKKEGYDGAVYDGSGKEPIPEYLSFYPEKVKIEKKYIVK